MGKLTEKQNEEFNIEEKEIEMKKTNLLDALQKNIRATENLIKFEVNNNSGTRGADDSKAVEILERSIARNEKCIQEKEEDLQCPVCLETVAAPVFMCRNQHIICSRSNQQSQQVSPVHGRAVQAARKAQIRGEAGRGAAQYEGRTQRVDGGTQRASRGGGEIRGYRQEM